MSRLAAIAGAALLGAVLLDALSATQANSDLWGYLAFGRLFWEQPGFPYHDPYAYAPTRSVWVYHEWLTGVLFEPLFTHLGAWSLQLLRYVLALATVGLTAHTARRRGASPLAVGVLLTAWSYGLSMGYSPVRAHIATYLFFALFLFVLERYRREGRPGLLWLLPPVMVIWANLHGGFVAGLGLLGLYWVGHLPKKRVDVWLLLAGVACLLVTLINPYGLEYWTYLWDALTLRRVEISEWAPAIASPAANLVSFAAAALVGLSLVAWARRWEPTKLLVLIVTLSLGLQHSRHQIFFIIALTALVPTDLDVLLGRLRAAPLVARATSLLDTRIAAFVVMALSVVLVGRWLVGAPWELKPFELHAPQARFFHYPMGAIDFMRREGLRGNILPRFAWGELILWELSPQLEVGMDGRYETVYRDDYSLEYFDFIRDRPGADRFLDAYPHQLALFRPNSPPVRVLERAKDWEKIYEDDGSVLFRRID